MGDNYSIHILFLVRLLIDWLLNFLVRFFLVVLFYRGIFTNKPHRYLHVEISTRELNFFQA